MWHHPAEVPMYPHHFCLALENKITQERQLFLVGLLIGVLTVLQIDYHKNIETNPFRLTK